MTEEKHILEKLEEQCKTFDPLYGMEDNYTRWKRQSNKWKNIKTLRRKAEELGLKEKADKIYNTHVRKV